MSITRRDFIFTTLMAAGFLGIPKFGPAQSQSGQFQTLRRNVGIYSNRGGTIGWLINRRGAVVVDTQFPDEATACLAGVKERQRQSGLLDAVINSHHHGDHTGGNAVFREYTKTIVAHKEARNYLAATTQNKAMLPDTVYDTTFRLSVGDERIHLTYYGKAHTSGDSVILFERANIIHMGDLMFNRVHPFIDTGSGAHIQGWANLLKSVRETHDRDTHYIFGHGHQEFGVLGSGDDLLHFQHYLEALLEYANSAKNQGKTKEELLETQHMKGFEHFVSFGARLSLRANLEKAWDELHS